MGRWGLGRGRSFVVQGDQCPDGVFRIDVLLASEKCVLLSV